MLEDVQVTAEILDATFSECESQGVHIPGALLKPNMIIQGMIVRIRFLERRLQISLSNVSQIMFLIPGGIPIWRTI